jgi:hypothetical protein
MRARRAADAAPPGSAAFEGAHSRYCKAAATLAGIGGEGQFGWPGAVQGSHNA